MVSLVVSFVVELADAPDEVELVDAAVVVFEDPPVEVEVEVVEVVDIGDVVELVDSAVVVLDDSGADVAAAVVQLAEPGSHSGLGKTQAPTKRAHEGKTTRRMRRVPEL